MTQACVLDAEGRVQVIKMDETSRKEGTLVLKWMAFAS